MKMSEITIEDVAHYLKLDVSDLEEKEIQQLTYTLKAARDYVKRYTGLSDEESDQYEDFAIAVYVLSAEMYENRQYQTEKITYVNKVVQSILDLHVTNLL